jgi:hypothetical protein
VSILFGAHHYYGTRKVWGYIQTGLFLSSVFLFLIFKVQRDSFARTCCYGGAQYETSQGACNDPYSSASRGGGGEGCTRWPLEITLLLIFAIATIVGDIGVWYFTKPIYMESIRDAVINGVCGILIRDPENIPAHIETFISTLQFFPVCMILGLHELYFHNIVVFILRIVSVIAAVCALPVAITYSTLNAAWGCYGGVKITIELYISGMCNDINSVVSTNNDGDMVLTIWNITYIWWGIATLGIVLFLAFFISRMTGVGNGLIIAPFSRSFTDALVRYVHLQRYMYRRYKTRRCNRYMTIQPWFQAFLKEDRALSV